MDIIVQGTVEEPGKFTGYFKLVKRQDKLYWRYISFTQLDYIESGSSDRCMYTLLTDKILSLKGRLYFNGDALFPFDQAKFDEILGE